ncbi:flagellar biosynthetic protein FliO [Thermaurantiacus sp.]
MLAEFLLRLAVALPLILATAVALLFAVKRGWLPLPATFGPLAEPDHPNAPRLDVIAARALQPGVRVAVVRYAGQDFLVGITPAGVSLLAAPPILHPETAQ